MSPRKQNLIKRTVGILVSCALLVFGGVSAAGQTGSLTAQDAGNSNKSDKPDFGSHESEMRAKMILKEEKKRYDEHLERAREVSQLAAQLSETYRSRRAFIGDDVKRLERLEKLAKRIRNEAGGSDTNPDVKDIPGDMAAAVKRAAEMAEDLRKLVEKTPRRVISTAVIDQANKLIGVIQYVRNPNRQGFQ
jgi:vacuolar-type H+-ATPase subunit I/STV1